jgi:NAD(P)H-hydrate repair Nnr-like enzyme with NAD(P)H-hydrate dehydratase domain
VIDGDGIKPLVQAQASRFAVRMRLDRGQLTVLTPLTLEASRFPGTSAVKVQADRLASAGTADGLADMMTTDRAAGSGIHEAASRAVYLYGSEADDWPMHSALTAGSLSRPYLL